MRSIGSVNSLVLVMLSCSVMSVRSITCYTCQADLVVSNGTCQEPHKAQYCEENDWCFKTWRGPEDNIAGYSWGCFDVSPAPDTKELCVTENKGDITETICYCSSDLCNYAGSLSLSSLTLLMCVTLALL